MEQVQKGDQVTIYHPDKDEKIKVEIEDVYENGTKFSYTTPEGDAKWGYVDEIIHVHLRNLHHSPGAPSQYPIDSGFKPDSCQPDRVTANATGGE